MINDIFKCYGDTVYLLATLRLPPAPPVVGPPRVVAPPDHHNVAPSPDDRILIAAWRAAVSLARAVARWRVSPLAAARLAELRAAGRLETGA
ncbi:MAG: hypothetical protein ACREIB_02780 [Pseudomonadota bacterium]